jgi:hypothetical protein
MADRNGDQLEKSRGAPTCAGEDGPWFDEGKRVKWAMYLHHDVTCDV